VRGTRIRNPFSALLNVKVDSGVRQNDDVGDSGLRHSHRLLNVVIPDVRGTRIRNPLSALLNVKMDSGGSPE
jgi:hypothetical protein